jgi:hypothetical protein
VRLRRDNRAPCGHGGTGGEGSLAAELWRGGRRRHWHVTGDPPSKVEARVAHRRDSVVVRWRTASGWRCVSSEVERMAAGDDGKMFLQHEADEGV